MLLGQYEGKIADKYQVAFPKKLRDELGNKLIITKGFENCLIIVSEDRWKTLLEGTNGMPFTNKNIRELQRFLLGNATLMNLDTKGRFIIPEYLRKYARLQEDIIFAGIERFVEVWSKDSWDQQQQTLSESIESIAEKLSQSPAPEVEQ